ncbi:hypothetical protein ANN_15388 [Periplaneta americana]|uniref:Uncharacterized protein n=1 Tax=Periplaneta americana TaxID=6978 RepID=A0ABQ8SHF0_PERAM|nr:hypothetical protein ANN_15388 [Periplaneta americana]
MPSTWPGIDPATFGIEGQRYTNSPTRTQIHITGGYKRRHCRATHKRNFDTLRKKKRDRAAVTIHAIFRIATLQHLKLDDVTGKGKEENGSEEAGGGNAEIEQNKLCNKVFPGSNTESYLAFARIGLRENPGKNLNQITCPDRDSNPGHLVSRPDALTVTPQRAVVPVPRTCRVDNVGGCRVWWNGKHVNSPTGSLLRDAMDFFVHSETFLPQGFGNRGPDSMMSRVPQCLAERTGTKTWPRVSISLTQRRQWFPSWDVPSIARSGQTLAVIL